MSNDLHLKRMSQYIAKLMEDKKIYIADGTPTQKANRLFYLGIPQSVAQYITGLSEFFPEIPYVKDSDVTNKTRAHMWINRRNLLKDYLDDTGNEDDYNIFRTEKVLTEKMAKRSTKHSGSLTGEQAGCSDISRFKFYESSLSQPIENDMNLVDKRSVEDSSPVVPEPVKIIPHTASIKPSSGYDYNVPQFGMQSGGISSSATQRKIPRR